MPGHPKNLPWPEIAEKYRKGASANALHKEYDVSRQAISKRAKKEGWENDEGGVLAAAKELSSVKALSNPTTHSEIMTAAHGKRTPETIAEIVRLLEKGVPQSVAAESLGIHRNTLRNWREDDPELDVLMASARMRSVARKIERIDEAGARGDVKSDMWYLERAKETREDFGTGDRYGPGDITVIVNVDRDASRVNASADDVKPPTIDVTPEDDVE